MGALGRKILLASIFFVSFAWVHLTGEVLTTIETEAGKERDHFYLPKANYIKPLLLGHEGLAADLLWVRTLGYFADELQSGKNFTYLEGLINLATDLDPRFEKIYIWAGAIYMYKGGSIRKEHVLASNRILKKGWRVIQNDPDGWDHIPNYWMIPQMIGFNYAIELRDRDKGAPYIEEVARIPGSPELYKTWAATLYKKSGKMEEGAKVLEDMLAVETLEAQLASVKDKALKEKIEIRLKLYYDRIYSPEESRRRVKMFMDRIQLLVNRWRESFPYLSFRQFVLLTNEAGVRSGQNREEEEVVWNRIFPILTNI